MDSAPRLAGGQKLHLLGAGYGALLDRHDVEVSEHQRGHTWVGVESPGNFTLIFQPDSTGADGLVQMLPNDSHTFIAAAGLFVGGDLIHRIPVPTGVIAQEVRLDFDSALAAMA